MSDPASVLDPRTFVAPEHRLFIDTNVFLDTDQSRAGALQNLFRLCAPDIIAHRNPLVVPTKVVDELRTHSRPGPKDDAARTAVVRKAQNALVFLEDPNVASLVVSTLGDRSNPYADDLFVELFRQRADDYKMCLITRDRTLHLRVDLLARELGRTLKVGELRQDGFIQLFTPQETYARGQRKVGTLRRRIADGTARPKDEVELESLLVQVEQYRRAFPAVQSTSRTASSGIARVAGAPRAATVKHAKTYSQTDAEKPAPRPFAATTRLVKKDGPLSVTKLPGVGDPVVFRSPEEEGGLVLGELVGSGGEGSVYEVEAGRVVKIFDAEHLTQQRRSKVELLVSRSLRSPGIAFPEATVENEHGEFVGYLMGRAGGSDLQRTIGNPRRFRTTYPNWTKADLVDVCLDFLEKISQLHALNIIVGDINPKNVRVDADRAVWIIDADSWQLEGHAGGVGTAMFTPPARAGQDYGTFLRTLDDELYAIATMLFMILMTGQFPYARAGFDGDVTRAIAAGEFAFQFKINSNRDQPAGNWKYMWSHLHPDVKSLFWNTFHRDGDRYRRRPSVAEWEKVLRAYRSHLGSTRDFDPMSNAVYPERLKMYRPDTPVHACPGCGKPVTARWDEATQNHQPGGRCDRCRSKEPRCTVCGKQGVSLHYGRCFACNNAPDNGRLCERCGQPFITLGAVEWHQGKGITVPRRHRSTDTACVAPPRQPRPAVSAAPSPRTVPSNGQSAAAGRPGLVARILAWFRSP